MRAWTIAAFRPTRKVSICAGALLAALALCGGARAQGVQLEDQFLHSPEIQADAGFGHSVSIADDVAAIAAPFQTTIDAAGNSRAQAGAVYVFRRIEGSWELEQTVTPDVQVEWNWFGFDVAVSDSPYGKTMVVGAIFWGPDPGGGGPWYGATYVFRKTAAGWQQEALLTESEPSNNAVFGFSVAAAPDVCVATAPQYDSARGAFHVYRFDGLQWNREAGPITPAGMTPNTQVGEEIAMYGDCTNELILVSAAHLPLNGTNSGTAFVYRRTQGQWALDTPLAGLGAGVSLPGDAFGQGLSIHRNLAAVACPARTVHGVSYAGSVQFFEHDGTAWRWVQTIDNPRAQLGLHDSRTYGRELVISGDRVVIGSTAFDDYSYSGFAHAFRHDGTSWTDPVELAPSDRQVGDVFGTIGFDDGWAIVGAFRHDVAGQDLAGAAYAYQLGVGAAATLTAQAGDDQSVLEGSLVTLDGSASASSSGDPLNFVWTQLAGTPVTLDVTDPMRPTFTAPFVMPGGTTLTFQLVVGDCASESAPDVINVTVINVNHAPVAIAGDDQAVAEGSPVTLSASLSYDEDDDWVAYSWTQIGGTPVFLDGADSAHATFIAPYVGAQGELLTFALTLSDGMDSSVDTVDVWVENVNHEPTAEAGLDQTRLEGAVVTLDGSTSQDPDGDGLTYTWQQTSGPTVVLFDANAPVATFVAPPVGIAGEVLTFTLIVDDGYGGTSTDAIVISVQNGNTPPACDLARASVTQLWPPNHKLVPVTIEGVTDPDDESVTVTILGVTQDEPINGLGDGDTAPDAVIQGKTVLLRAERSGTGNGRVYRVTFLADDGSGGACTGTVLVRVPHSMGAGAICVEDAVSYDSLGQ